MLRLVFQENQAIHVDGELQSATIVNDLRVRWRLARRLVVELTVRRLGQPRSQMP